MRRKLAWYIAGHLALALVIIFFGAPFLWLFFSAFDPKASAEFRIPEKFTLDWFKAMYEPLGGMPGGVIPLTWIVNSIIISVSTATLVTFLTIISAYSLTRYRFKGQEALLSAFVIFRLMPMIVVAIPVVVIYAQIEGIAKAYALNIALLNTFHGLVLVMSALILPFTLMIAEGYFRALPVEYEEAAMVDGCSRFVAFMKVTLPLALPGVATIWLLSFVTAWGEFLLPLVIMRSPYMYPASVGIYYWFGMYGRIEYGRISAFSLLFSFPSVVVFLIARKYLARGMAGLVTR